MSTIEIPRANGGFILASTHSQKSEGWFRDRAGRIKGSEADSVMTASGSKSGQWPSYAIQLVTECNNWKVMEFGGFCGNRFTDHGEENEKDARDAFKSITGLEVMECGFVTAREKGKTFPWGCSPDGLVMVNGKATALVEIKCRQREGYCGDMAAILSGSLPSKCIVQIHHGLICTGLNEAYFVTYCPGHPTGILHAYRDAMTVKLRAYLEDFTAYYSDTLQQHRAAMSKEFVMIDAKGRRAA